MYEFGVLPVVFMEHVPGTWDAMLALGRGVGVQVVGDQHDAHLARYIALQPHEIEFTV